MNLSCLMGKIRFLLVTFLIILMGNLNTNRFVFYDWFFFILHRLFCKCNEFRLVHLHHFIHCYFFVRDLILCITLCHHFNMTNGILCYLLCAIIHPSVKFFFCFLDSSWMVIDHRFCQNIHSQLSEQNRRKKKPTFRTEDNNSQYIYMP